MIEMEVTLNDVADNFKFRVAREGHFAREHDVQDDAERPNIDLRVIVLKEDFWGDIVGL